MKTYAAWMGIGALAMFGLGRLLALTEGCSGFCDPIVSTSFGLIAGAFAARMSRTA